MIATITTCQFLYCCLPPISSHATSIDSRLGILHCEKTSINFTEIISVLVKCLCVTGLIFCMSPELLAQDGKKLFCALIFYISKTQFCIFYMKLKNAAYCIICHSRQMYRYQIASHAIAPYLSYG